jgi:hypothetical protein
LLNKKIENMTTNTKWLIGLGVTALAVTVVVLIVKHNEEPKGIGEVSADSKGVKIIFTRKK